MIYDFQCKECGDTMIDVVLPLKHLVEERPQCCGKTMAFYITKAPGVHFKHYEFKPFRVKDDAFAEPEVITSHRKKREFMARNDLVDANDFGPPPSHEQEKAEQAEVQKTIDAITPPEHIRRELGDIV